ncbi:NAD(P)/FAD-dependent oxidoreductase [Streptococcus catagoni]|uniref:NAD(P)/FAD-dependent oxidoreductase n=1 Tax=Streptococcus catagoni TaxID=2654874 RepID=UPI001409D303|nr:FAD-dependent oxidoreductase [Streptococcus catagoni]
MKVAIIGAGIVGSTAAYYLRKNKVEDVTIFDDGEGQATKAAAGIICPWFSKRRHKAWYRLASSGAEFYQDLIEDLSKDGFDTSFYRQNGVLILKMDERKLEDLLQLALERKKACPMIGELAILDKAEAQGIFQGIEGFTKALYASGAARIDGAKLCHTLQKAAAYPIYKRKVSFRQEGSSFIIDEKRYDYVILASGAWLGDLLKPLGYEVAIRPQKGQLLDFETRAKDSSHHFPVLMPEGEIDIIPFDQGLISVGASHENDQGFDLQADQTILKQLREEAQKYYPELRESAPYQERIGTRAYTDDFCPFWGQVPHMEGAYAASGLGSSGLTVGPKIGRELVSLLLGQKVSLDSDDYPIGSYISYDKK